MLHKNSDEMYEILILAHLVYVAGASGPLRRGGCLEGLGPASWATFDVVQLGAVGVYLLIS